MYIYVKKEKGRWIETKRTKTNNRFHRKLHEQKNTCVHKRKDKEREPQIQRSRHAERAHGRETEREDKRERGRENKRENNERERARSYYDTLVFVSLRFSVLFVFFCVFLEFLDSYLIFLCSSVMLYVSLLIVVPV